MTQWDPRNLGLHLQDDVSIVVGEPDLGLAAFGENALGLDDRLDDDGVELPGGDLNVFAPEHPDPDRVSVEQEVVVEARVESDAQANLPDEVEDRRLIDRM